MIFQNLKNRISQYFYGSVVKEEKSLLNTKLLMSFSRMSLSEVFKDLNTSEKGLTASSVRTRLKKFGLNEVVREKPSTWYALLFNNFKNPFVVLLIFLAIISFIAGEIDAVFIISSMVIISILMRFIQEFRAAVSSEKLKNLVSTKTTVKRRMPSNEENKFHKVNIKHLVPGDIILLSAGDLIPADIRLISAKDLYVSQGSLTGESFPVEKDESLKINEEITNPLDMPNLCFAGTNVVNGSATAVILLTGERTYFGLMAKEMAESKTLSSFDIGINKISWLLLRLMIVMVPIVFLINALNKGDLLEAFLFSLSVAVGLTPEMLPMIVTANLARGAINMSRSKVIVKQLDAIQNFGAMNVFCADKTGTLTENHIILEKYLNAEGQESAEVLAHGYLNSYYQTGLKNLLDSAILSHSHVAKELKIDESYRKIDELPYDFTRRRMSVIVETPEKKHLLICKGAFDEILSICHQVKIKESTVTLTKELKEKLKEDEKKLSEDGLRVLGVAYKEILETKKEYVDSEENNLVFLGYLAFLDPPKHSATKALALLKDYNVQVKILTGDNELVTQKICKWVHLPIEGILTGDQLDKMDDNELQVRVKNTNVFAKLNPLQKTRVISALKSNGNVVGYLGDGINDAPALRKADVGISVNTGVDIAKECASIIMLEKSLLFLGEGVMEGRRTFGNMIKYVKMATSSNFGNVFSIVGASALFPFLPMLPVQLLTQNLLYDFSQIAIPFDNVDEEFLSKPRQWDPNGIAKFMIFIGPISSIYDYITFGILWFVFHANSLATQGLFQSGWFIEGLLSQTLIVHMIRTRKIPFIQSIASFPLLLTTVVVMVIGIYIPYSYVGHSIGFTSPPADYFYWIFAILLLYCTTTQLVKMWFIKRFNYWL